MGKEISPVEERSIDYLSDGVDREVRPRPFSPVPILLRILLSQGVTRIF